MLPFGSIPEGMQKIIANKFSVDLTEIDFTKSKVSIENIGTNRFQLSGSVYIEGDGEFKFTKNITQYITGKDVSFL